MSAFDAIARLYDLEHDSFTSDTPLYLGIAGEAPIRVLVLGAGTGRVVRALANGGHEVWGLDHSTSMLEVARRKLASFSSVRLVNGDMRSFQLRQKFDLIVAPLDTFTLLESQEDQVLTLKRCRQQLAPGGRIVIDAVNPYDLPDEAQTGTRRPRFEAVDGDVTVTAWDRVEIDRARQRMIMQIDYEVCQTGDMESVRFEVAIRWLYRFELEALLRLTGFAAPTVFGDYGHLPYGKSSPRLIVVAVAR